MVGEVLLYLGHCINDKLIDDNDSKKTRNNIIASAMLSQHTDTVYITVYISLTY